MIGSYLISLSSSRGVFICIKICVSSIWKFWSYTESSIMLIKISIAFVFIVLNKNPGGNIETGGPLSPLPVDESI